MSKERRPHRPDARAQRPKTTSPTPPAPRLPAGYAARDLATRLIDAVLVRGRALDDALEQHVASADLEPRDRGLARLIAATVLRRLGQLEAVLALFIEKPLPEERGNLTPILLSAAAQLAFLATPPHAAINIAVEQCRRNRGARRFDKLANAVLRRVAECGPGIVAAQDAAHLNIPGWMLARWTAAYGAADARRIALASLEEADLDITLDPRRTDRPQEWAERLGGALLPTGSIRLRPEGPVPDLPGFADGAWWVQDAAAALPHRLLGPVRGQRIADLCAAPGGKSMTLAALGAEVTAVDISAGRLARVRQNLDRLKLAATLVEADATEWQPAEPFDAVLLDAPCIATGTIRRHPDILRLKRPDDLGKLVALQQRLLDNAVRMVKPGGLLVYCSCSLEPEEGVELIARCLEQHPVLVRERVEPDEIGGPGELISAAGDLRTLPFHMPEVPGQRGGLDGFFAARLRRRA